MHELFLTRDITAPVERQPQSESQMAFSNQFQLSFISKQKWNFIISRLIHLPILHSRTNSDDLRHDAQSDLFW